MCQGCVAEGKITQRVLDAIDAFDAQWDGMPSYGPAHVVIADQNVEDHHIEWCLEHWDKYEDEDLETRIARRDEYEQTKLFLKWLLSWPIEERLGPAGLKELAEEEEDG